MVPLKGLSPNSKNQNNKEAKKIKEKEGG